MVTIHGQSATTTLMDPLSECLALTVSTLRAILARIGRVHGHQRRTGPCCLVREVGGELRPRSVNNAFGQAVVMHHPVDRQIFNGNDRKPIDQFTAFLVAEVAAPIGNAFMDACDNLSPLGTVWRALLGSRQLALGAFQVFLVCTQELGTGHLFACRKRVEARQADINARCVVRDRSGVDVHVAGDTHIPLPSRRATHRTGFWCAFKRTVVDNPHSANLRQFQDTIHKLTAVPVLREGHRIIATVPTAGGKRNARGHYSAGFARWGK